VSCRLSRQFSCSVCAMDLRCILAYTQTMSMSHEGDCMPHTINPTKFKNSRRYCEALARVEPRAMGGGSNVWSRRFCCLIGIFAALHQDVLVTADFNYHKAVH